MAKSTSTSNDKLILSLKKEIETKKSLLAKTKKFNPNTNCLLQLDGQNYNIRVFNKEQLVFFIARLNSYKQANLLDQPLIISGFSVNMWLEDMMDLFNILNVKQEESRLKVLEDKLYNLLSVDKKVELEIEDIKNQI